MDATRDDHTKESNSARERQILYNIIYVRNLNYDTNEHIYRTETETDIENNLWLPSGGGSGERSTGSLR